MRYFVDSNIFIRFFTKEKNTKVLKECSFLIDSIKKGKLKATTSHLVIAEVVWTLSSFYKAPKEDVVKVTQIIESLAGLRIEDKFVTGIAHRLFEEHSVKYIDALIASTPKIQSKAMSVVSYDKDFDKLGVIRKEPSQIV
jgi:predicted nucleic-acid-binding protein